jgi:hypothetical protein
MPLFRFKRRVSFVNAYPYAASSDGLSRFDRRMIEAGTVLEERPMVGVGVFAQDFEELPDPRDTRPPGTLADVASACDVLLGWVRAGHVVDPRTVMAERLYQLWEAAAMLPDGPATPFDAEAMHAAQTVPELVRLAKLLRQWASDLSGSSSTGSGSSRAPANMSCQQAAEWMDNLSGTIGQADGPTTEGFFFQDGAPHKFPPLQWRLLKTLYRKGTVGFKVIGDELWGHSEWNDGRLRKLVSDTNAKLLGSKVRFEIISPMDGHYLLQELPAVTPEVT